MMNDKKCLFLLSLIRASKRLTGVFNILENVDRPLISAVL